MIGSDKVTCLVRCFQEPPFAVRYALQDVIEAFQFKADMSPGRKLDCVAVFVYKRLHASVVVSQLVCRLTFGTHFPDLTGPAIRC